MAHELHAKWVVQTFYATGSSKDRVLTYSGLECPEKACEGSVN